MKRILIATFLACTQAFGQSTVFEYPDGLTVKFNPNGTRAGLNFGSHTSSPSSLSNGDVWYDATEGKFKFRQAGSSVELGAADLSNLNASNLTSGTVPAARFPALTGDVTTNAGAVATTLATVNGNVGAFGSSTAIPTFTVNGKGLITAASTAAVVAPAGTLTGTTLAANVTGSSLTGVGTITSGTWSGAFGAVSGANLTNLNGGNISSGNIAVARIANALTAPGPIGGTTPGTGAFSFISSTGSLDVTGDGIFRSGTVQIRSANTPASNYLNLVFVGTNGEKNLDLPDEDGTLATREWITNNSSSGGNGNGDFGKFAKYGSEGEMHADSFRTTTTGTVSTKKVQVYGQNDTSVELRADNVTGDYEAHFPNGPTGQQNIALQSWVNAGFQAGSTPLTIISGLAPAANRIVCYDSGSTGSLLTLSDFAKTLIDDAANTNARTTLGLVIGTDVQAFDADLTDLADGSLSGSKVGSGLDAGNITTGTVGSARLGSGTANSSTFLRGDGSWQSVGGGFAGVSVDFDGGGVPITAGSVCWKRVKTGGTITGVHMLANTTGSCVIDVWKCTQAQWDAGATHPVSGDKITASAPPTISASTKSSDTTLTGWTTTVSDGDILYFYVTSCSTITKVTVHIE